MEIFKFSFLSLLLFLILGNPAVTFGQETYELTNSPDCTCETEVSIINNSGTPFTLTIFNGQFEPGNNLITISQEGNHVLVLNTQDANYSAFISGNVAGDNITVIFGGGCNIENSSITLLEKGQPLFPIPTDAPCDLASAITDCTCETEITVQNNSGVPFSFRLGIGATGISMNENSVFPLTVLLDADNPFPGYHIGLLGATTGVDIDVSFTGCNIDNTPINLVPGLQPPLVAVIPNMSCCDLSCGEQTDLTACVEEGDFGFITLGCTGFTFFDWDFPEGSTAIEIPNICVSSQTTIVNASEGVYTLTLTNVEGCTEVREFKVVADCCEATEPCQVAIPENPHCKIVDEDQLRLAWSPVSGATGYIITIELNSEKCCGNGKNPFTLTYPVAQNFFNLNVVLENECFAWHVVTDCPKGEVEPQWNCFDPKESCLKGGKFGENKFQIDIENTSNKNFNLYPNPIKTGQILHIPHQLLEGADFIKVENINGQTVKIFSSQNSTLKLDSNWSPGMYFLTIFKGSEKILKKFIVQS